MRHLLHLIASVFLFLGSGSVLRAQQAASPSAATPAPPVATSLQVFYPFPEKERAEIRELQYSADQLEIEIQKMQVEIEKNKAKQQEVLLHIRQKAYDFATQKKIDLDKFELDLKEVRFRERSKK